VDKIVWKYESGDKKSIFGKPFEYDGSKWVPASGGSGTDDKKVKDRVVLSPKQADYTPGKKNKTVFEPRNK